MEVPVLNFPKYPFRFERMDGRIFVYDEIRKKMILLTPEEWVRQHTVRFVSEQTGVPTSRINVEKSFRVSGVPKRYDVVVYAMDGSILLLVECKKHTVPINQKVLDQICTYNMQLKAKYLMLTNGLQHVFCEMDFEQNQIHFLQQLPNLNKS